MEFLRCREVHMSVYKEGRINTPSCAVELLQNFKIQNQHMWNALSVRTRNGFIINEFVFRVCPLKTRIIGVKWRLLNQENPSPTLSKLYVFFGVWKWVIYDSIFCQNIVVSNLKHLFQKMCKFFDFKFCIVEFV